MNCDRFRRAVTMDPAMTVAELVDHARGCADCRNYWRNAQRLNRDLLAAMAIDVPDARLPEPLSSSEMAKIPLRKSWTRAGWLGLAASIALVTVFAVNWGGESSPPASLADQVIAHLDHEPAALAVTSVPVSDRRFQSVVRPALVEVDRGIGLVTYAASCVINGREVPHLVVQGENGPVTILLLPHEQVAGAIPLQGSVVEGFILPVGNGSVAIIGKRGESIDRWRERVAESIHWTA